MAKKVKKQAKKPVPKKKAPKPQPTALAVVKPNEMEQINVLTPKKIELIKRTVAKGADNDELSMFLHVAQRSGLDPFARQIYFIKRKDGDNYRGTIQTGIDGLRSIAERSGSYAGSDDPKFEGETKEGYPAKCTVTVYKIVQGQRVAFTATARWEEYYPGEKMGFMWRKMSHTMLAKCAESLALRKAFPAVMSSLYVHEEMERADKGRKIVVDADAQEAPEDKGGNEMTLAEMFQQSKSMIENCTEPKTLNEWRVRIEKNTKLAIGSKKKLLELIDEKLARFQKGK